MNQKAGIPAVIVHGGTGAIDEGRLPACIAGCEVAARAGHDVLERGGSALDAVEAAVRVLEDNPEFNAGYGADLNRAGVVEVDACIMDGRLRAGAVGAVPWIRHPVTLARRVLEDGEHLLLVADGALLFAHEHGIVPESPERMIAPGARTRLELAQRQRLTPASDTVGACALDGHGGLASATSTGGTAGKRPGRIGDAPLPGAGTYADELAGAASATGHGESIIRVVLCKGAIDRLRQGIDPERAARQAVAELVERTGGEGGIILLDRAGGVGHHASAPHMPWAAMRAGHLTSGFEHS